MHPLYNSPSRSGGGRYVAYARVEEGLLGGLIAQAELTELLDEFYADL